MDPRLAAPVARHGLARAPVQRERGACANIRDECAERVTGHSIVMRGSGHNVGRAFRAR